MKAKRCIIIMMTVLLVILSSVRIETQAEHKYYFPQVYHHYDECGVDMGLWSYIAPEGTTNLITNPSLETNLTGWASPWGDVLARSATQSKFGIYSLQITGAGAVNAGASFTDIAGLTPGSTVTFSAWIYNPSVGGLNAQSLIVWDGGGFANGVTSDTFAENDTWTRYDVQKVVPGGGSIRVAVFGSDNAGDLWMDAAQAEVQSTVTTYCDGDQNGCEWLGAEHASQSRRSALSRAGGTVVDFADLDFDVSGFVGAGKSPITLNVDNYALLPGGELNSQKTNIRSFTLTGWIEGTSIEDLHVNRQALIEAVSINQTPEDQPLILRYTGASVVKEIDAYYQAGLEGRITARFECLEQRFALRFLSPGPNFREIGESSDILDTEDTATSRIITAKLRSTGQWDDLGPPNVAGGPYTSIRAIAVGSDGIVYIGGDFQNFDNIANADRIVSYDPVAGTYSALGTGMNNIVRDLLITPDGTLYAVGDFNVAGGGAANFIASWNGAAWAAVGVGLNNSAYSITLGEDGLLYIGGFFTDINGGPGGTYNRIITWNGAAWGALGTGLNALVHSVIYHGGTLYVGGSFTTAGGGGALRVASWDGSSWSALSSGTDATVNSLDFGENGILYAGGNFTTAGGSAALKIASWNGVSWSAMGSGVSGLGNIEDVHIAPDGVLFVGGNFDNIGGIDIADGLAKWNGATWAHVDVTFPGVAFVYVVATGMPGPIIEKNYDIWVGHSTSGAFNFSGLVIVDNGGTQDAFPRIVISRSGGASATLEQIRNETLGLELIFDYDLVDDEILTIDLSPTNKSIVSSAFGSRFDALLPNSDFGAWRLRPGVNEVSCFVDPSGGPTVAVAVVYQDQYWSTD